METKKGEIIFSSQPIAKYIANLRRDTDLLGADSLRDSIAIEDWTNWAAQELELPVCVSYYMTTKCIRYDELNFTKSKKDIACALSVLERHFQKESSGNEKNLARSYLVLPDQVTLADIIISCYLVYPFTLVFDEADLEDFPKVMRWFLNCMQQPEFISVLGIIKCRKSKR